MSQDARAAANAAVAPDACTARYPHAPRYCRVRPDAHVVGNLYLVVQFDIVLNHGVIQCATVNRGIRPDLYIIADDNPSDLRNF